MTSGDAGQGAQALRPLVTALARHGDQVALLCHSYGSVVCGLAAPHLPVTDIAVFGSPGMDASSVASLHTPARVWAGRESGDSITYVPHIRLLGLGFGTDPMTNGFGARLFATGTSGHSGYLDPGSVSLRNLDRHRAGRPRGGDPMTGHPSSSGSSPGASTRPRPRTATVRSTRCAPWPSRGSSAATGWSPRSCSAPGTGPATRHGAERQQPAGLDAVAGPAVLDLPDARGLLPGRRLLGGPRLPGRIPGLAAQAPDPSGPSGCRPGRGLDPGHRGPATGGRPGRDRAHAAVPGHQPAVVPGRVRRADRADPGRHGAGPEVRRVGRGAPGRHGGRHRPRSVRAFRAGLGGVGQPARPAGSSPTCSASPGRGGRCAAAGSRR